MRSEDYSSKDRCLRSYDQKCNSKPKHKLIEVDSQGVWEMWFCDYHWKEIKKEKKEI